MKLTKYQTNVMGVIVLATILIAVFVERTVIRKKVHDTQSLSNEYALKFANVDRDILLKWNSNELKDAWGHQFKVENSKQGIRFVSSGVDNSFSTPDDIYSEWYMRMTQSAEYEIEEKPKKGVWSFLKDKFNFKK